MTDTRLSVRALAAGAISVGFDGAQLSDDVRAALDELPFGGLIIFGRNVRSLAQARELTDSLRARYPADAPPLISIDQEGGRVARIRDGVEEIPSMMAVSAAGDIALARAAGEQIAFDLRRAGTNVNFAPVLDLALERMNTVIGTRAFSNDPRVTARFAGAVAAGLEAGGIVATYKHFPGHGSTAVDSHLDLPTIDMDAQAFAARDLMPFADLLPSARAVMTAHIVFRALDDRAPATLSRAILTDLLRGTLGFKGVCFTDCMQMDAIARTVGSAPGAVIALIAGADSVLISHSVAVAREAVDRIEAAVADGSLPLARLQEAYDRVLGLRKSVAPPLALDAASPHAGIGREIGGAAVTLVRGTPHVDPAGAIVLSFQGTTTEGVQGTHSDHASLREFAPALQETLAPLEPDAAQTDAALAAVGSSGRRPIVLMRRAHVYASQAAAIARVLATHPDAVIVSTREPFDITLVDAAQTVLATYGDDRPSLGGLADVLFGGRAPAGSLPLEIAAVA